MKKTFLLTAIFLLGLSSCKDELHDTITILNNYDRNICITKVLNKSEFTCINTPDKIEEGIGVLGPFNSYTSILKLTGDNWENKLKTNTLKVYFIKPDHFNNYSCEEMKSKKLYIEKTITLDFLNQNNWTVSYP